jgi:hypothetical protein
LLGKHGITFSRIRMIGYHPSLGRSDEAAICFYR